MVSCPGEGPGSSGSLDLSGRRWFKSSWRCSKVSFPCTVSYVFCLFDFFMPRIRCCTLFPFLIHWSAMSPAWSLEISWKNIVCPHWLSFQELPKRQRRAQQWEDVYQVLNELNEAWNIMITMLRSKAIELIMFIQLKLTLFFPFGTVVNHSSMLRWIIQS